MVTHYIMTRLIWLHYWAVGTYIMYFVWMLKVWKDLQNQNGWELNFITAHDMTFLSNFLSRGSHWADGCDQTVTRDT